MVFARPLAAALAYLKTELLKATLPGRILGSPSRALRACPKKAQQASLHSDTRARWEHSSDSWVTLG